MLTFGEYILLKLLFSSVSGKDLTIIEVSETGLTSSVQLYNARRRQSGTEYLFLYLKCDTAGNRTRDLPRLKLTPYLIVKSYLVKSLRNYELYNTPVVR